MDFRCTYAQILYICIDICVAICNNHIYDTSTSISTDLFSFAEAGDGRVTVWVRPSKAKKAPVGSIGRVEKW